MNDWAAMFNERGALLAFFGALGGAVRSAAIKTTWREGLRVIFIGSAMAFGVGALGPRFLHPVIGDMPVDMYEALGTLCAASFIIGLTSATIIERILAGKSAAPDGGE